jgi:radial spoke head protein 4A
LFFFYRTLFFKVHHVLHILPQGRTKWWNPNENADKEEEETEEEEEIKANAQEFQPEQGPPLLTPVGTDAEIEHTKAWTTKISSNLIPQYACAFIRSNLWPGAYTFARGMLWENIYVGYGHKYTTTDYKADLPPLPASEYSDGPEIAEAEDPTPEDEAKANAPEEQGEEGEEDHEEEPENGEDDD